MSDDTRPAPLPGFEIGTRSRLQAMLVGAGWTRLESIPGLLEFWGPSPDARFDDSGVVVPLDQRKGDFTRLYARALDTLQRYLGPASFQRLEVEIDAEFSEDLVRTSWKREASTRPGSIPWPDGRDVFDAITRQLIAAARAAVSPQPQLGRANAYVAQDFLAATILAPSGAGSYVVNALTPLHRHIYISPPIDTTAEQRPRERRSIEAARILATFDSALSVIQRSLEETSELEQVRALTSSPGTGVSQELLSALADFAAGQECTVVTPRHAWSGALGPRETSFRPKDTTILHRAAAALARTADASLATVSGVVTRMEHEPESERRVVRVFTTSRGPVRRVTVNLDEEDYDLAVEAHRDDSLVRIRGRLAKVGKFWTIEEPQDFKVLDPSQEAAEIDPTETLFDGLEIDRE